jgi:predicted RNase H-like HicB family nuclease
VPAFRGCYSQGETAEEAVANVKEAISLTIDDMRANGEAIPDPSAEIHCRVAVGQ